MSSSFSSATKVFQGCGCQLSPCSHCSEEVEQKRSNCNVKETYRTAFEDSGKFSVCEDTGVGVQLDGCCNAKNINIQDCSRQTPSVFLYPGEDGIDISEVISICQEFSQSLNLAGEAKKYLSRSKTFPPSKETSAGTPMQTSDTTASGNSAYARSISLPPSSTLISAMKGGRAQSGLVTKSELSVKWAPGVYDPPVTTVSHTVKGHQQRPKKKKKDKNKRKNRSSRGGGGERKLGNHKCFDKIPEPLNPRLQANGNMQTVNGLGKCKVIDMSEYVINSQDAKCSGSFLWETLPKIHLPIGEAS